MRAAAYALSVAGGAVVTAALAPVAARRLSGERHIRTNYRGRSVTATLGVVLVVPLGLGCMVAMLVAEQTRVPATVAGAGLAFGLLGLVDDLYGDRREGGLLGHLRALARGRVTTGSLKAAGGAAVGLGAAWVLGWRGWEVAAAGAVVALGANLANLLDLRPGRALKVWIVACAALLGATGLGAAQLSTAGIAGGVLGFLPTDLRERGMLGDVGAGVVGASLATATVAAVGRGGLLWCLAALVLLTLVSELASFSRLIDAVAPLRALDRLGRAD